MLASALRCDVLCVLLCSFVSGIVPVPQYPNLIVSCSGDGHVKSWTYRDGNEVATLPVHECFLLWLTSEQTVGAFGPWGELCLSVCCLLLLSVSVCRCPLRTHCIR